MYDAESRFRQRSSPLRRHRIGNTTVAGSEESLQGGNSGVRTNGWCRIGAFVNQPALSVASADHALSRHGRHSSGIHDRIVSTSVCDDGDGDCSNIGSLVQNEWSPDERDVSDYAI